MSLPFVTRRTLSGCCRLMCSVTPCSLAFEFPHLRQSCSSPLLHPRSMSPGKTILAERQSSKFIGVSLMNPRRLQLWGK